MIGILIKNVLLTSIARNIEPHLDAKDYLVAYITVYYGTLPARHMVNHPTNLGYILAIRI